MRSHCAFPSGTPNGADSTIRRAQDSEELLLAGSTRFQVLKPLTARVPSTRPATYSHRGGGSREHRGGGDALLPNYFLSTDPSPVSSSSPGRRPQLRSPAVTAGGVTRRRPTRQLQVSSPLPGDGVCVTVHPVDARGEDSRDSGITALSGAATTNENSHRSCHRSHVYPTTILGGVRGLDHRF